MTHAPVTVIIPFYDGHAFLDRALSSIQSQTLPPAEIIIVDDGSSQIPDVQFSHPVVPVRVISHTTNKGVAAARNTGVRAARTRWIAFLDQDDEWLPHKTELQWNAVMNLGDNALQSVFYGRTSMTDPTGATVAWPRSAIIKELDRSSEAALRKMFTHANPFALITMMTTTDAIARAGGFDESLKGGSDDYALLLRLAATGHRFVAPSRRVILARRHETGFNYSDPRKFLKDDVALLSQLSGDFPHLQSLLPRALAAAHYRTGNALLDDEPAIARTYLTTAFKQNPLNLRALSSLLMSYSSGRVRSVLRRVWRAARRVYYKTGAA